MTTPARPFRIEVTQRRVEELRRLALYADATGRRLAGDDDLRFAYAYGVRDTLRWLAGDEPMDWLQETLQP